MGLGRIFQRIRFYLLYFIICIVFIGVLFTAVIDPNERVIDEAENTICDSLKKQHALWLDIAEIEEKRTKPNKLWRHLNTYFSPEAIEEFNQDWENANCAENGFGRGPMNEPFIDSISKRLEESKKFYNEP